MTFDDEFVPNETCDICGRFAGFETSPEGEACSTCGNWVCEEHVDWAYMRNREDFLDYLVMYDWEEVDE